MPALMVTERTGASKKTCLIIAGGVRNSPASPCMSDPLAPNPCIQIIQAFSDSASE